MITHNPYDLWLLLSRTKDALFQVRQAELSKHNISVRKYAVLHIVSVIGDNATPAEIARWLFRAPHSISELIDRMEREGLVRKVKDLARKNQIRVVVTDKGLKTYQDVLSSERNLIDTLTSLSQTERQQLWTLLNTLRENALEKLGVNPLPFIVEGDDNERPNH